MNVVIMGAAGMLGRKLAARLSESGVCQGKTIRRLTLVDVVSPACPENSTISIDSMTANLLLDSTASEIASLRPDVIFHLAAMVSGEAEAKFIEGYEINFQALHRLLEALRKQEVCPRLVFSSSLAVYGPPFHDVVSEDFIARPSSSYGAQKAMAELLIADYTRKGFLDGVTIRLPTIVVRPGTPNAAASSFLSGIIREPLNGQTAVLPVAPDTRVWIASPQVAIDSLIKASELSRSDLGSITAINLRGLSTSIAEMIQTLEQVAGKQASAHIVPQEDPVVARIVCSWPSNFATPTAERLGFPKDHDFHTVVQQYISENAIQLNR